jgi:threonine aldolase
MQLASKMRYAAAQFVALLTDDLWRRNAAHANAMAARLAAGVAAVPGVEITHPVEANAVFAVPPPPVVAPLQERYPFYVWDEATGEVRWMTSFATTESDVDGFLAALAELVPAAAGPVG